VGAGWAVEQVVDVSSAHLSCLLMTVVGVLRGELNENGTKERKEGGRTGCCGRGGWGVEVDVEIGLLTTWVGGRLGDWAGKLAHEGST